MSSVFLGVLCMWRENHDLQANVQLQPQFSYYWTSSTSSRTFIDSTSFVWSTSTTESVSLIIESFQKFIYLSIAWKHGHNSHTQYWSRPSCSFACQYVFITAGSLGRAVELLICFFFLFNLWSAFGTQTYWFPQKNHTLMHLGACTPPLTAALLKPYGTH